MPRRSSRITSQPQRNYDDSLPYPEGPPTTSIEKAIHMLNLQAFSWTTYATVDDIIVYAFFASKRKKHHYRALNLACSSGSHQHGLSVSDGIAIEHACEAVNKNELTFEDCQKVADTILHDFSHIFPCESAHILSQ